MTAGRLRLVARLDSREATLMTFAFFSLGIHLLLLSALIFLPMLRPRRSPTISTMPVSLVAAPPGPAVEQPSPAAAPPAVQQEPAEEVKTTPEPVEPVPQQEELPAPQRVQPAETEPAPTAPPSRPPMEHGGANAAEGGIGPTTGLVGMGTEFDWYREAVNRALYTSWKQPILQGLREPLEVAVYFEILRDGSTRALRIENSSGLPALDRSALRAVQEALLPPLPRTFREPTQEALVTFRHYPEEY